MRHVGMSVHTTHPTSDRHLLSDTLRPTIRVERWTDPVVDRRGHDPRSLYVERFWLGAIGPSATWIMRRLADRSMTIRTVSPSVSPISVLNLACPQHEVRHRHSAARYNAA